MNRSYGTYDIFSIQDPLAEARGDLVYDAFRRDRRRSTRKQDIERYGYLFSPEELVWLQSLRKTVKRPRRKRSAAAIARRHKKPGKGFQERKNKLRSRGRRGKGARARRSATRNPQQGFGRKRRRTKRRKVHFGSRGGRYVIKNGRKKYL